MIENYSALTGFSIGVICLAIYVFFLAPKQLMEVMQPRDWLTKLRWIILTILVVSIITSLPSLLYQYYRSLGYEYTALRNVATVSGNVSKLGTTILLILVYTYRRKN